VHVLEVSEGEIMSQFAEQAKELGIQNGAIASVIGGVTSFVVSTMPAHDDSVDEIRNYNLPGEMHGCGEIKDGMVHIHATFAIQGDRAVSGHLHEAYVQRWFARAYVIPA
jgi:uncharacterized protein